MYRLGSKKERQETHLPSLLVVFLIEGDISEQTVIDGVFLLFDQLAHDVLRLLQPAQLLVAVDYLVPVVNLLVDFKRFLEAVLQ